MCEVEMSTIENVKNIKTEKKKLLLSTVRRLISAMLPERHFRSTMS